MVNGVTTTLVVHMKDTTRILVDEDNVEKFLKEIETKKFVNVLMLYIRVDDIDYIVEEYEREWQEKYDDHADNSINQI